MSGPRLIPIENVGIFFCLGGSYKKQNELQLHVLFVRNRRGLSRTLSLFPLEISGTDHLDHLGGYLIFTATFDWFSPDGTLQDPFDGNPLQRVARIAFVRFQRGLNTKKRLKKGRRQVWNTRGLAQDQNIKIIHQQRGYFGGWCFFFFLHRGQIHGALTYIFQGLLAQVYTGILKEKGSDIDRKPLHVTWFTRDHSHNLCVTVQWFKSGDWKNRNPLIWLNLSHRFATCYSIISYCL